VRGLFGSSPHKFLPPVAPILRSLPLTILYTPERTVPSLPPSERRMSFFTIHLVGPSVGNAHLLHLFFFLPLRFQTGTLGSVSPHLVLFPPYRFGNTLSERGNYLPIERFATLRLSSLSVPFPRRSNFFDWCFFPPSLLLPCDSLYSHSACFLYRALSSWPLSLLSDFVKLLPFVDLFSPSFFSSDDNLESTPHTPFFSWH